MNIRITDLLDDYFDDSVKLLPPETLETGDLSAPQEPRAPSRLYKPLLVAATLMLVISAAIALGLGFQRGSGSGYALAEGTPSPSESLSLMEPAMESVQGQPEEAEAAWTSGTVTVETYQQSGSHVNFRLELTSVPEDMISEAGAFSMEAVAVTETGTVADAPVLEYITLESLGHDQSTESMLIYGTAALPEAADWLNFYVRLHGCNGKLLISENAVSMRLTALTGYAAGSVLGSEHRIYDLVSPSDGTSLGMLKWYEISATEMNFLLEIPTPAEYAEVASTGETPNEEQEAILWEHVNACVNILDRTNAVIFNYADPELLTLGKDPINLDFSIRDVNITDDCIQNFEGTLSTCIEVTADLSTDIDPLQIHLVEFAQTKIQNQSLLRSDLSGNDQNGDGMLSTELSIPFTHEDGATGTITGFYVNPSTGEFWELEIPALSAMLLSVCPDGDLDTASHDPDFNQAHTDWNNAFLEAFMKDAQVVFADGSSCGIGSGDVPAYNADIDRFLETSVLPIHTGSTGNLEIAYLLLDGQTYYFK